jgi:3-oxoacyl-[acyl-carrier-protein] synthase II
MTRRRVVITGLGLISPVGNTVAEGWANLLAGRSGIDNVTRFDASGLSCRFAGEVKGFNVEDYIPGKEARHMDTFIHYGMAAAIQAVQDAGLPTGDALNEEQAERIGCLVGSGIGGLPMIEQTQIEYAARGARRISPFFVPASIINMISGHISIKYGFTGPNLAIVTACTTGLHAIGEAGRLIEYGDADVMVAGGAESTVSPLGIGGFAAARALSTRNDSPQTASRPWDKDRDGFVLGEGAGVLVLEEYEHAKQRGAKIYAELAGFGMGADAFHMTAPNVDGPKRSMRAALRNAGINADAVQYLNAHGTSTPLGDLNETNAIKLAFGDHAKKLVVNSTKSMTGHLLGGAGGIESVFTTLAVHHQVSPPTINIFSQDPECDLDYCANTARDMKIDVAVKNNFGFGGTNGTLVLRRV